LSSQAVRLYEIAGKMEDVAKRLQDLTVLRRRRLLTTEEYLEDRSLLESEFTQLEKELALVLGETAEAPGP